MAFRLIPGGAPETGRDAAGGAFALAVQHTSASPAGWLWLHAALSEEAPSAAARRLAASDDLAGRSERVLEALREAPGADSDELLKLHEETHLVVTAAIERLTQSSPSPRTTSFSDLTERFQHHVELTMLLQGLRGEPVAAATALARIFEAFEVVAEDLLRTGSVTEDTWRRCEEIARGSVSLP